MFNTALGCRTFKTVSNNSEIVNLGSKRLTYTSSNLFLWIISSHLLISVPTQFLTFPAQIHLGRSPSSGASESNSSSIRFLVLHSPVLISTELVLLARPICVYLLEEMHKHVFLESALLLAPFASQS